MGRSGVVKSKVLSVEEGKRIPNTKATIHAVLPPQSPNPAGRHETNVLRRNGVDKRDERQGEKKVRKSLLSPGPPPTSPPPSRFPRRSSRSQAPGQRACSAYIHLTNGRRKRKKKKREKKEREKKRNPVPKESNPGDWESILRYRTYMYVASRALWAD